VPITPSHDYFIYLTPALYLGPILIFEFLLFGFAFRNFWKQVDGISGLLDRTSLKSVIVLDNIIYYAIVLICYIVNLVVWLSHPAWASFAASFSLSITSMVGCRLIVHLCDVYYRPFSRQTSMWVTALPMEVAERTGLDLSIPMSRLNMESGY
jgi:hypothetical protein